MWVLPVLLAVSVTLVNAETPRFRVPIDPFLILLASCALGAAPQLRRSPVGGRLDAAPPGEAELVEVGERLA